MISFLADHCFDEDILRGIHRRNPSVDFLLARDVGLAEAEDPEVLAWAAEAGRVTVTHDRNTMIAFAIERIRHNTSMAGLLVVNRLSSLSRLIDDIALLAECSEPADWVNRIEYVPL